MKNTTPNFWNIIETYAAQAETYFRQLNDSPTLLLCSNSTQILGTIGPLLQSESASLITCAGTPFSVGYIFPLQLWADVSTFAARSNEDWERCWNQAVLQGDKNHFLRAILLRAVARQSSQNGKLLLSDKQWQQIKIPVPTLHQKKMPIESWFNQTELRVDMEESEDWLSRLEGKPLEQVLGNYQGRESERRTDPFDRKAR